jgi:hypothetical protein
MGLLVYRKSETFYLSANNCLQCILGLMAEGKWWAGKTRITPTRYMAPPSGKDCISFGFFMVVTFELRALYFFWKRL